MYLTFLQLEVGNVNYECVKFIAIVWPLKHFINASLTTLGYFKVRSCKVTLECFDWRVHEHMELFLCPISLQGPSKFNVRSGNGPPVFQHVRYEFDPFHVLISVWLLIKAFMIYK